MTAANHFITQIYIEKLLNLENISIDLSTEERQHLLLTGKNGSGKTSLLNSMAKTLSTINERKWILYKNYEKSPSSSLGGRFYEKHLSGIRIEFNSDDTLDKAFASGDFVTAFFPAHRKANIHLAHGVENIELAKSYKFTEDPALLLIKYMVHLKTQQAYARQENDSSAEESIQRWFERFQVALSQLMDDENLKLEYNYKQYNFLIHQKGKIPFDFNSLSDGYSSVIKIVSDLILRMEQNWLLKGSISHYDVEGIALIDELETHLHIELQRKILPFLTTFFPRIQFIVSTHSPYILTSIPNAVIYDLEKQITFTDMTKFSIDDVAEAFFETEDYSLRMEDMIKRYKALINREYLTVDEKIEKTQLSAQLQSVPGKLAMRIQNEFDEIIGAENGKN